VNTRASITHHPTSGKSPETCWFRCCSRPQP
jgi:hypothetical protein